jgi:hypothetical protein
LLPESARTTGMPATALTESVKEYLMTQVSKTPCLSRDWLGWGGIRWVWGLGTFVTTCVYQAACLAAGRGSQWIRIWTAFAVQGKRRAQNEERNVQCTRVPWIHDKCIGCIVDACKVVGCNYQGRGVLRVQVCLLPVLPLGFCLVGGAGKARDAFRWQSVVRMGVCAINMTALGWSSRKWNIHHLRSIYYWILNF